MAQQRFVLDQKQTEVSGKWSGLAPVACYDPWFPRTLDTIKQAVHDGQSVLIRLHSGASYPIRSEERYANDVESHAVLIVGYDDDRAAVAIVDPWNKEWGGLLGGRRWISYATLGIVLVNTSLGQPIVLSTPEVHSTPRWDQADNLILDLQIGFYIPRGTVMDHGSWVINGINVRCVLPPEWGGQEIEDEVIGQWKVGEKVSISMPICSRPQCNGQLDLNLSCGISGTRPYVFDDCLEYSKAIKVAIPEAATDLQRAKVRIA